MGLGSKISKATGGVVSRDFVNQAAPWALGGIAGGTLSMGLDALGNPFSSPASPGAPDYKGAAEATAAGNLKGAQEATRANRANQYNPFGSSVWTQGPGGEWSQKVSFSPEQQKLFDLSQSGMASMMGQPMPEFGANRESVMKAMMGRSSEAIAQDRAQMESQLAAQGIPRNSPAFDTEMARFDRRLNDAQQQAEISATGQAATEYGSQLAGRGQQFGMYATGMPQAPQFNQFYNQQAVPGADYLGAAQQQGQFDMNQYNAQVAQKNAMMQGLFGLGAAGITAMSDRRLKKNIIKIGESLMGLPIYLFKYIWSSDWTIGHMADEVKKVVPEAVIRMPNGYDAVNYGMLK